MAITPSAARHARHTGCGGRQPPAKKRIYLGAAVIVWGQVEIGPPPSFRVLHPALFGPFQAVPSPKRGAGWKTPGTRVSCSALPYVSGFSTPSPAILSPMISPVLSSSPGHVRMVRSFQSSSGSPKQNRSSVADAGYAPCDGFQR